MLRIVQTEAAGVVAVHFALATEELAVLSVAADPSVDRGAAFEAAYEVAQLCRQDDLGGARCSLFDLPLGSGHSWEITEHEVLSFSSEHQEEIEDAVLPAWSIQSRLDLKVGGFGVQPALGALLGLIGPSPLGDVTEAVQSAVASYTPTGFEAAAATGFGIRAAGIPREKAVTREARLVFDHPYVAVALAGTTSDFRRTRAGHTEAFGLPLFGAWVAEPEEPKVAAD